jgi:hypothetical protein
VLVGGNSPGQPAHLSHEHPKVQVVFVQPNTISLNQPMDKAVIGKFIPYYLRTSFAHAVEAMERDGNLKAQVFWKKFNLYDVVLNMVKTGTSFCKISALLFGRNMCPQIVRLLKNFRKDET